MTSMVSTAVAAIVAALSAGTPVAAQIARVRLRPMAQTQAQAVVVRPLQAQVTDASIYTSLPVSWTSAISVECYARTGVATTPDVAVDSLAEAVYARLMADPTLGGVVLSLTPQSLSWDFDADGDQTVCAAFVFHALHRSAGTTLS
jgi:hypothetical protein